MTAKSLGIIFASACLACSASSAGAASAGERSPFLGQWQLDLARMPDTYGPPPKRVTFTFKDVGSGQWRTIVEIIATDDSVRHMEVQYRRDGKTAKSEGDDFEADSAAFNSPAPNVLVASLARNKGLSSVRTWVVSPDGKEMTEAAADVDQDGVTFVRNFHFKRISR